MSARGQMRLKELAAELGLSITTVSRALAGYTDVAAATRSRVAAAAKRVGYVPSSVGRMLVSGRTDFIGMLLPLRDERVVDPFVGAFVTGLSEGLAANGRDLFIGTVPKARTPLDVIKHIVDGKRADALVIYRTEIDDACVRFLLDRRFPFVCHGRALAETRPYVWFDTDGEAAFAEAVHMLVDLGHRDFGMLTVAEPYSFAALRRQGAVGALAAAGLPLPAEATLAVPMADRDAALTAAERLVSLSPRPTAVLCATDALALALIEAAQRKGIAVPAELSVIGFDNIPVAAYAGLSTFDQRAGERAHEVADMVVELLDKGIDAVPSRLVRPQFVARGSHDRAPQLPKSARAA